MKTINRFLDIWEKSVEAGREGRSHRAHDGCPSHPWEEEPMSDERAGDKPLSLGHEPPDRLLEIAAAIARSRGLTEEKP